MELLRISIRDFFLCATYYFFPIKFLDFVISNLTLPEGFLHDFHFVHSGAVYIFQILFLALLCIDVILCILRGRGLTKGVDYVEIIRDTVKETFIFSILIGFFSLIVAMSDGGYDLGQLEQVRSYVLIGIITLMYFMGAIRVFDAVLKRIKNVFQEG